MHTLIFAVTDSATLFAGLSAASLLLSALTSWLVYRRDQDTKKRRQTRDDKNDMADLVVAERRGWEMLLTNLRREYESTCDELAAAQAQLQRARDEIVKMRERIQHLEEMLNAAHHLE